MKDSNRNYTGKPMQNIGCLLLWCLFKDMSWKYLKSITKSSFYSQWKAIAHEKARHISGLLAITL